MTNPTEPRPIAWLCELMQEDGTTRQQFVTEDPDGLRWNDAGEPSPFKVTPLYAPPLQPADTLCQRLQQQCCDMGLYPQRDHVAQGEHYIRHVEAMTREGLHSKSRIAGELAARDIEIERLRVVATAARNYFDRYMQDEADDEDEFVCGKEQHESAAALRDALKALVTKRGVKR